MPEATVSYHPPKVRSESELTLASAVAAAAAARLSEYVAALHRIADIDRTPSLGEHAGVLLPLMERVGRTAPQVESDFAVITQERTMRAQLANFRKAGRAGFLGKVAARDKAVKDRDTFGIPGHKRIPPLSQFPDSSAAHIEMRKMIRRAADLADTASRLTAEIDSLLVRDQQHIDLLNSRPDLFQGIEVPEPLQPPTPQLAPRSPWSSAPDFQHLLPHLDAGSQADLLRWADADPARVHRKACAIAIAKGIITRDWLRARLPSHGVEEVDVILSTLGRPASLALSPTIPPPEEARRVSEAALDRTFAAEDKSATTAQGEQK